jgi:hypothetical protein
MRFAEGTLENFWPLDRDRSLQGITTSGNPRIRVSLLIGARSKPQQTAKIFSAGSETIKSRNPKYDQRNDKL